MEPSDPFAPLLYDQRLINRVLRHWSEMATGRRFPRLKEIDPWMLGDDWLNCALIRLAAAPAESSFMVVGENLMPGRGQSLVGKILSAIPEDTVLGMTLSHLQSALVAGSPVSVEGATGIVRGASVIYRSVLAPLSEDGESADYVLVAANHRVQTEKESVAPFSRETVIARQPAPT